MGLNDLPAHMMGAGACGGLHGPSDVENRDTDTPTATFLSIWILS